MGNQGSFRARNRKEEVQLRYRVSLTVSVMTDMPRQFKLGVCVLDEILT